MLSKNKRVTKELFQKIMNTGGSLSSPFFVFRYLYGDRPQYAFVAPKSVAKRAVDRNKLRRIGYNTLNSYTLKNFLGIFFYKKQGKNASTQEIKEDIVSILKRLK
jgi:RNase P protein component